MNQAEGGCLCGKVRYAVTEKPARTTICHCKFCQRATGSAYLVEPIFEKNSFKVTTGKAKTYDHRSDGSGKMVHVHFCADCGTKLFLTFERFPDVVGLYGGTLDDPNWIESTPDNTKHIFMSVAQHGTIIPAGVNTFMEHATTNNGNPIEPTVFSKHELIKHR